MSTTSVNGMSPESADAARRDAGLELGVEINALLTASRALTERTAAAFHPNLQPAAFHLARWLHAYGPTKPSALAEAVGMDRSSTSNLIGQMKALGLVESTPDLKDRRAVTVSLTPAGVDRVVEVLDLRGTTFFERTKDWTVEDLRTFASYMRAFTAAPTPPEPA